MDTVLLILAMCLPTLIILLLVTAIINNKKGNSISTYTKGVKIAYSYVLVISSLLMIIFGSIGTVNAFLEYLMPESEINLYCDKESKIDCSELRKELTIRNEKYEGIIMATACFTIVLIGLPIFIVNTKEAKKYKDII